MKKLILSLVFMLGIFSQASANTQFIFQNSEIEANGVKAKVFLGVPVNVLENLGDKSKIELSGYLSEKNLYSTKEKELLIAIINDGFKVEKIDNEKVKLVGTIANDLLSSESKEVWEEHEEFFFDMCTQCHAAQVVSHHTMIEWEALFQPMKGFAKLNEEEAEYLLRYIKSNASNGLVKITH